MSLAAAPVLSACGSSRPKASRVAVHDVATSPLSRVAADASASPDAVGVIQAFSADLYRQVARVPGNLVCSPYSVAIALAMTRNGARGQTATEMDSVLHAPETTVLNSGLNALQHHLDSRAGERILAIGTTGAIALDAANSLWGQEGTVWEDEFLDALARDYGAGLQLVDYVTNVEGARDQINTWTADKTHDRIPELVPADVLTALTRLVLVNAIYLKAPWHEQFEPVLSRPAPFTRADGSTVRPQMMHGAVHSAGYASGPGWRAVDLPYAGTELAMAVVLPDEGNLEAYERALDADAVAKLLTGFKPTGVNVDLPRWTFRTQASLAEVLAVLGMPTAFSPSADFSGMTTQEQLSISAVMHEAFIAVDEAGTEAAAATAAGMAGAAAPAPLTTTLTVDRSFFFVIHDVETATPLFMGRVDDPTA